MAQSQGDGVQRFTVIVGLLLAVLAAGSALAQSGPPRGRPADLRGEHRMGPPPGRPMPPPSEAAFPGSPPTQNPAWRMTPDERRQLRQDIHQHGLEVYGAPDQRGRNLAPDQRGR